MLNKSKGQMYPWVSHTWNIIKGKCPHDCYYCYMHKYPQPELHFDARELKTNLGEGNTIFVGSSCDAWADALTDKLINDMLEQCRLYPKNTYLFQSKNPARFGYWLSDMYWNAKMPPSYILGTTIESNRDYGVSKAPLAVKRVESMVLYESRKMVSIEPVLDFDVDVMVEWIKDIKPEFVSIGADSQNNHLPEPSGDKVKALVENLKGFTEVKIKGNLKRLLGKE